MLARLASTETRGRISAGKRIRLTSGPDPTITPVAWPRDDENHSHGRSPEKRKTAYFSMGARMYTEKTRT
jgi:hypothetical protein